MCRNIRILFNFDPPTTDDEIHAAALQYVRKVSGTTNNVAVVNRATFDRAVEEIAASTRALVRGLTTSSPPRNREEERQKARVRNLRRFGGA